MAACESSHEKVSCLIQDADYFRRLHKETVSKLQEACRKWLNIREKAEDIPEFVIDEIDLVTGQAKLLTSQRLSQFESLIDDHELGRGEKLTNLTDLQGFWDMIHFQVEDIDRKVANLESLSRNGWKRTDKVETPVLVSKHAKRSPVFPKSVPSNCSRSAVRRFIRDAQRRQSETPPSSFDNGDPVYSDSRSQSPVKSPVATLAQLVKRAKDEKETTDL